jgi:glycosyltransferase involved in cell wall biosynthesis
MACRTKTPRAREVESTLRRRVADQGLSHQVTFVGETRRIHDLLACSDAVVLPSVDLYAKMDYPLVLLEAMSLARPVVVARGSAAEELCEAGGALGVEAQADALASLLGELADDAGKRARVGADAARAVLARYTYAQMAAAYEALYDRLLA